VRHIRCQLGGYGGGGYGDAPSWAARGANPGVYLDSRKYMRDTLKLFEELRARLGFGLELVHDVHERIHPTEAVQFAREMEPYKLFFLEDCVPHEQLEWLSRIKQLSVTPLSQGELFNNPAEFKRLVANRSIDFMRAHLSQLGGITPARRVQMFCEEFGVRICWHGPGDMSPIAHAANIHIDLAAQNLGLQEWSGIEPPNFVIQKLSGARGALLEVFPGLPEYGNDGFVYASDRPGLGVDIDDLCTIYRTQFAVLHGYDQHDYTYDANGRLVPNSVLSVWRKKGDAITEEERTAVHPGSGIAYTYELPFGTLDREADLRTAYAEFERRLAERSR